MYAELQPYVFCSNVNLENAKDSQDTFAKQPQLFAKLFKTLHNCRWLVEKNWK